LTLRTGKEEQSMRRLTLTWEAVTKGPDTLLGHAVGQCTASGVF